jgi:type II secretory pathway pseudopilin PulG
VKSAVIHPMVLAAATEMETAMVMATEMEMATKAAKDLVMIIKNKMTGTKNKKSGFLLIELIVALFIFSMVATVSIGSIITIFDANKKAQSLQSVMNNLNLAMDSMTKALAVGKNYTCEGGDTGRGEDCQSSAGNEITFLSQDDVLVVYAFKPDCFGEEDSSGSGCLTRLIDTDGDGSFSDEGDPVPLTAREVNISNATFFVHGTAPFLGGDGDTEQPRVLMFIEGTVKAGPRNQTKFSLQTAVSQRIPDL